MERMMRYDLCRMKNRPEIEGVLAARDRGMSFLCRERFTSRSGESVVLPRGIVFLAGSSFAKATADREVKRTYTFQ